MSALFQCDKLPDNYYNSLILLENAYYVSPSQERIAEIFKMYQIGIEFYSENNNDAKSERLKAKIRFLLCSSQTMNTIYKPRIMRKYESNEKLRDKCEMIIKQINIERKKANYAINQSLCNQTQKFISRRNLKKIRNNAKNDEYANKVDKINLIVDAFFAKIIFHFKTQTQFAIKDIISFYEDEYSKRKKLIDELCENINDFASFGVDESKKAIIELIKENEEENIKIKSETEIYILNHINVLKSEGINFELTFNVESFINEIVYIFAKK